MLEYILDQCRQTSTLLQQRVDSIERGEYEGWKDMYGELKHSVEMISGHLKTLSKTVPDPLGGGRPLRSDEDYDVLKGLLVTYLGSIGVCATSVQFEEEEIDMQPSGDLSILVDVDLSRTQFNPTGFVESKTWGKPLCMPDAEKVMAKDAGLRLRTADFIERCQDHSDIDEIKNISDEELARHCERAKKSIARAYQIDSHRREDLKEELLKRMAVFMRRTQTHGGDRSRISAIIDELW